MTDWKTIKTADGSLSLVHPEYDEMFHSDSGALLEAKSLYVEGSGILDKLSAEGTVRVLDIGLGLGYNALATIESATALPNRMSLEIISLEKDPQVFAYFRNQAAVFKSNWPEEWHRWINCLEEKAPGSWQGVIHSANTDSAPIKWTVFLGDALDTSETLKSLGTFDYFWQDPFSPQKNPLMWSKDWFTLLNGLAKKDAVLMTYSVSRMVKDALTEGGWQWQLIPTVTQKKNWLRASPV